MLVDSRFDKIYGKKSSLNNFVKSISDIVGAVKAGIPKTLDAEAAIEAAKNGGVEGALKKAITEVTNTHIPKLAQPVYTTGSQSKTAAVDVYGKQLNSPQSSIISKLASGFGGAVGGILGAIGKVANDPNIVKVANAAVTLNQIKKNWDDGTIKKNLKEFGGGVVAGFVQQQTPGIIKAVSGMAESLGQSAIAGSVMGAVNGVKQSAKRVSTALKNNPDIKIIYDGAVILANGDYETTAGILKTVDRLTGKTPSSDVVDKKSEKAVFKMVTSEALKHHMPSVFTKLIDKFDTREERQDYILDNIAEAIDLGNGGFIDKALEKIDPDLVKRYTPDAIARVLAGHNPLPQAVGQVDSIEQVLAKLDPKWDVADRAGTPIKNLGPYTAASSSAVQELLKKEEHRVPVMLSGGFQTVDIVRDMQNKFPQNQIIDKKELIKEGNITGDPGYNDRVLSPEEKKIIASGGTLPPRGPASKPVVPGQPWERAPVPPMPPGGYTPTQMWDSILNGAMVINVSEEPRGTFAAEQAGRSGGYAAQYGGNYSANEEWGNVIIR